MSSFARNDVAADLDHILVRLELEIIAHADRRDDDPQVHRKLLPEVGDAREEVAALRLVHQRDQAVADLELERVDLQIVLDPLFLRGCGGRRGAAFAAAAF